MANIQASINQAISLTALLATQNPAIQAKGAKRAELSDIDKKLENLRDEALTIAKSDMPEDVDVPVVRTAMELSDIGETDKAVEVLKSLTPEQRKEYGDMLTAMSEKGQLAAGLKARRFELDPSEETYKSFKDTAEGVGKTTKFAEAFSKADESILNKQRALEETRRRILEGTPSEYLMRGGK